MVSEYDVVIIGSGPSGLSAAIYTGQAGLKTLVVGGFGSQLSEAPHVTNYLGFESVSGVELLAKFETHIKKIPNIELKFEDVVEITKGRAIITSKTTYKTKAVIIASGAGHNKLRIKGENEFLGRGVSYCAVCDGNFFKGKVVAVLGGGNSAVSEAIYLKKVAEKVYLIHRRNEFRANQTLVEIAKKHGIKFLTPFVPQEIKGNQLVEQLVLKNNENKEEKTILVNGVFVSVGKSPQTNFLKEVGVILNEKGEIIVDENMKTNISWIFAAGDVTNTSLKQIITAASDGAKAAMSVREFLSNN
ncbi:MAG: thioredoxin-disulfide reductase [Candidatus Huberarchaeum crystalense]|uniref:Thioredoxin-disulfide reductase n=1 Tax=Huberarchaeum crystalense TaxID=2014257 RepID=A0A2G9LJX7_HUBC1|nr:FAD-dependent oxidoreductase [archaeon]OIP20626.1 MAG: hypothetical protein AUJ91_00845 [archaeon CG2_30_31_98]PIN66829.1 MAG: thioredoxin-disulfide reductase [Candidatus Huberarchaeum crystalense]NCS98245.1 FAD-dependent oxidoreductase [archaeon]PIV13653.1 MAG: thioredoxin-disulfide reductase [Candidatus Huberarchaeum crystalense]